VILLLASYITMSILISILIKDKTTDKTKLIQSRLLYSSIPADVSYFYLY